MKLITASQIMSVTFIAKTRQLKGRYRKQAYCIGAISELVAKLALMAGR